MRIWIFAGCLLLAAPPTPAQDDQENPRTRWTVRDESERPAAPRFHDVDPEQDPRYWAAVTQLTDAFNDEDLDAYTSLLSERYKSASKMPVRGLMDFMSGVIAKRGAVDTFHALKPKAMEVDDSDYPIRSFVFHLEDGTPGTYGIALDDDDKIDHLSLFVKAGICPNGKNCPDAVVDLESFRRSEDHE